jgi:hypothetical protein
MFAVVITGPPGAGKSEVASYLHDILGDEGIDAALVECDALERSYPALERERSISHLRMLASSYRDVGSEVLLVTATIEGDEHLRLVLDALDAPEHLLVLLHADPETMRERLLSREPPGWSGLPELLNASRRLAGAMPELDGIDVAIATDGRRPSDVAAELHVELDRHREAGAGR